MRFDTGQYPPQSYLQAWQEAVKQLLAKYIPVYQCQLDGNNYHQLLHKWYHMCYRTRDRS